MTNPKDAPPTTDEQPRPIAALLARLDMERLDLNLFRGLTPDDGRPRVYGGLVAAQALMAACRTVDERRPHSLHAYFLRPGDPKRPIIYDVDRIRDGRSFTTRRVLARQHGEVIFNMAVSFHVDEPGLEHQAPMPAAPPPDGLPNKTELLEAYAVRDPNPAFPFLLRIERPVEQRLVDHVDHLAPQPLHTPHRIWFRADGPLPDDPAIHECVLAYASDSDLLDTTMHHHGRTWLDPNLMIASLDHAIWFHRPARADDWLLYVTESTNANGGRGMNHGRIYTQDGVLIASVAQEALVRLRRPRPDKGA